MITTLYFVTKMCDKTLCTYRSVYSGYNVNRRFLLIVLFNKASYFVTGKGAFLNVSTVYCIRKLKLLFCCAGVRKFNSA